MTVLVLPQFLFLGCGSVVYSGVAGAGGFRTFVRSEVRRTRLMRTLAKAYEYKQDKGPRLLGLPTLSAKRMLPVRHPLRSVVFLRTVAGAPTVAPPLLVYQSP
jgi:hypothetical protein